MNNEKKSQQHFLQKWKSSSKNSQGTAWDPNFLVLRYSAPNFNTMSSSTSLQGASFPHLQTKSSNSCRPAQVSFKQQTQGLPAVWGDLQLLTGSSWGRSSDFLHIAGKESREPSCYHWTSGAVHSLRANSGVWVEAAMKPFLSVTPG